MDITKQEILDTHYWFSCALVRDADNPKEHLDSIEELAGMLTIAYYTAKGK